MLVARAYWSWKTSIVQPQCGIQVNLQHSAQPKSRLTSHAYAETRGSKVTVGIEDDEVFRGKSYRYHPEAEMGIGVSAKVS